MIKKITLKPGERILHNLNRPLRKRLESRRVVGPYIFTPANAGDETRSFYLDSDFAPGLRWQWCDKISYGFGSVIRHQGWFCDEFQDQTIRGVVFRLPGERGFLAGWSMGESMASAISTTIYDDEIRAAHAADSLAERVADKEREYQLEHTRECF